MIIKNIHVEKFRAINDMTVALGKNITAIAGRNATLKTTLLGMLGQPFSISRGNPMFGCTTIDGYSFKSQFNEKFKLSDTHDIIGEHIWTLNFYNNGYYTNNKIKVESQPRPTKTSQKKIRFWNAESKAKGSGYVQLPVYYLSLSRLFPIGEIGRTKSVSIDLTNEENEFFVEKYKEILSIQNCKNPSTVMEKADSKRSFIGINDDTHDVFTNSAGESNLGRIILAILSFKRLKEQYPKYKGGILLIDELDATLYGYSQKKLIQFLYKASKDYKVQIICTTHSPIILKEVNNLHRQEIRNLQDRHIDLSQDTYNYECEVVYLQSEYMGNGDRMVVGQNIRSASKINEIINDINLRPTTIKQDVNVYLEDNRAKELLEFLLSKTLSYNFNNYFNIIDVDLSWNNYVQLHEKKIPEFLNSIIVLDNDVKRKADPKKLQYINIHAKNMIFLPFDVEEGLFRLLKVHSTYNAFEEILTTQDIRMNYDICFKDWVELEYESKEYKNWLKYMEDTLGGIDLLLDFWYKRNEDIANSFVSKFVEAYNLIAENLELDYMMSNSISDSSEFEE